jgi:hypothetical protein
MRAGRRARSPAATRSLMAKQVRRIWLPLGCLNDLKSAAICGCKGKHLRWHLPGLLLC